MKKRILFALGIALLSFNSCRPDLQLSPAFDIPDESAFLNNGDVQDALTAAYEGLQNENFLGGSAKLWPDIISDHVSINPNSPYLREETNIANGIFDPSDSLIIKCWSSGYQAINRANHVIQAVEKNTVSGQDFERNKDRYMGEALFVRAVAHFELARLFAPQYSDATRGLSAIPLRTSATTERAFPTAATVEQVYQQAIEDLTRASNLLPFSYNQTDVKLTNINLFGNATASAALAYLARVYFQMGEAYYPQAIDAVNRVIGQPTRFEPNNLPSRFPDRFSLIPGNSSNLFNLFASVRRDAPGTLVPLPNGVENLETELVFQIMNSTSPTRNFSQKAYLRFAYGTNIQGTNPRYIPSRAFLNNSANGPFGFNNDTRFVTFFAIRDRYPNNLPVAQGGRLCNHKFSYSAGFFNMPIIRTPELMLIRSEAYARQADKLSDTAQIKPLLYNAAADLLFLKRRANRIAASVARFMDNPAAIEDSIRTNPKSFVKRVINECEVERNRELCFEGVRLHNLRRLGIDTIPSNNELTLPVKPKRFMPLDKGILPIPVSETATNPNISNQ